MLHLSREGQALGRRTKGLTRTLIHLECPDPDQPARLRLWVEKSFDVKPPALGVTMGEAGNEYDDDPPEGEDEDASVPRKRGKVPFKLDACKEWLADQLRPRTDPCQGRPHPGAKMPIMSAPHCTRPPVNSRLSSIPSMAGSGGGCRNRPLYLLSLLSQP